MKPLFLLVLVMFSAAANDPAPPPQKPLIDWKARPQHVMLKAPAAPKHQGCCSYHQGVCGCDGGTRARCCDGTDSPSCGCN